MDTFGKRLKAAIKASKRQSKDIAVELGITPTYLSAVTSDKSTASDRLAMDLCRLLGINKRWLMTGKGDMYDPEDRLQAIARLTTDILEDADDSFKSRLIVALSKLNSEDWQTLKKIYTEILGEEEQ